MKSIAVQLDVKKPVIIAIRLRKWGVKQVRLLSVSMLQHNLKFKSPDRIKPDNADIVNS